MGNTLSTLLLVVACSLSTAGQTAKDRTVPDCLVETQDLAVGSGPTSFLGMPDAPAKIVATEFSGLGEHKTRLGLEVINQSGKTIAALKLEWFLFRIDVINDILTPRKNPKFIMQGESSRIETGGLAVGEEKSIYYWIGSCQDTHEALVNDSEKGPPPWVEAVITEVFFTDGSRWKR